jgi:uncharacterized protein
MPVFTSEHALPGDCLTPRRPLPPAPIELHEIHHPMVPESLDGFTILHLTDLHVRRGRPKTPAIRRLLDALAITPVDLVALTGDYMTEKGDEETAAKTLREISECWRSVHGAVGVFGNHDSAGMATLARRIPAVRWLQNGHADFAAPGAIVRVLGASFPEDLLSTALAAGVGAGFRDNAKTVCSESGVPVFPLTLVHYPTEVYPAATLGLPLVLSGHTHGGQIRFSRRGVPHTSTDLPGAVASGLMRLRHTLCVVSRGLGQAVLELRLNCPPQAPLLVLRRGAIRAAGAENVPQNLDIVEAW